MRMLKNPYIHAALTLIISLIYGAIFILISGNPEFEGMLNHSNTLSSTFWNNWSSFLRQGDLKYIGYLYIALAICMITLSFLRKKNYDEYQAGILSSSLVSTGLILLFLFPITLLLVLSDPNYAVEAVLLLIVAHWSVFLMTNLIYAVKWWRE